MIGRFIPILFQLWLPHFCGSRFLSRTILDRFFGQSICAALINQFQQSAFAESSEICKMVRKDFVIRDTAGGQSHDLRLPDSALPPTPIGVRSEVQGTLPRPKNSPPDCFYGSKSCRRPFESHYPPNSIKKEAPTGASVFMGWVMGLEPTIFRATI